MGTHSEIRFPHPTHPVPSQAEVSGIEQQVKTLRDGAASLASPSRPHPSPSASGVGSPSSGGWGQDSSSGAASIAAAELDAREAERQRWAAIVDREREAGERRIAEVRAHCKAQYAQTVASLEAGHVAEFEAALAAMAARQATEQSETLQMEQRLNDARAALEEAESERQMLDLASAKAHSAGVLDDGEREGQSCTRSQRRTPQVC